jgi:Tol biopolymer transport system component
MVADGRWIAYEAFESDRGEIYVQRFPEGGGKWQITTTGGSEPYWTADGSEIIFRDESRNFLAIPVDLGETVRANIPEALF